MRIGSPSASFPGRRILRAALIGALAAALRPEAAAGEPNGSGERIYRERCAGCHGPTGEGVEGKRRLPLAGDRTVEELARFIARSMPRDEPGTCVGRDAEDVARYIHGAFYSPIARARRVKARIELSRLTVSQYRNAVADLVGSFRAPAPPRERSGLRGEYFDSGQPGRNGVLDRIDPEVRFDFGRSSPAPEKLGPRGFAVRWEGSVEAPDTGEYDFILRTDHAARLWINDPARPLIDAWVRSGNDTDHHAARFLIAGRAYPLRLEFSSRKQGVEDKKKTEGEAKPVPAVIELSWRPPGQAAEVIPARRLSPGKGSEVYVVPTAFPPDDRSLGYDRGTSVSRAWDEAVTGAGLETAGYVASYLDELTGPGKDGGGREARVREFSGRFVERAFRRPLSGDEVEVFVRRQVEGAPDLETAVKRVVLLALESPRFLYLDLGAGAPDPHSLAERLSFVLWDSLPDGPLLEAAAGGRLASREGVRREAERMVRDPRSHAKVREFLHRWLGIDPVPDLTKDPERFPGFGGALASDLRTSLDLFLDDVLWGEGSDFRRLFLSSDLYLNGRAARYYGFDLKEDAPFQKVSAGPARSAGVLTHPYLLARFASSEASSPIHRGVFIARSVLGRMLRPPPEAFAPLSPALHPDLTTRERVTLQTAPETCQSCHGTINPLGFALERFDAAGRHRDEERGKPIDASGSFPLSCGETRTFDGARALAELLAGSEEVEDAFVTKIFHHLVKQPILAYGPGTTADLRRAFAASGFNVPRLVAEIAVRAAFPPAAEGAGSRGRSF